MLRVNGRMMKGKKTAAAEWTSGLVGSEFFGPCGDHADRRRNERNVFCMDCNAGICKHCLNSPAHPGRHRWLQICKYVYQDVVRLHDIQKHLDCSRIQTYKINGEKAVHINPRPRSKKDSNGKTNKGGGGGGCSCYACGRHLQQFPNRYCSIACRVSDATCRDNIISFKISHFGEEEEDYSTKENTENESCTSLLTESSEVIQVWVTPTDLKPKKSPRKRKGVPCRAPLR